MTASKNQRIKELAELVFEYMLKRSETKNNRLVYYGSLQGAIRDVFAREGEAVGPWDPQQTQRWLYGSWGWISHSQGPQMRPWYYLYPPGAEAAEDDPEAEDEYEALRQRCLNTVEALIGILEDERQALVELRRDKSLDTPSHGQYSA